MARYKHIDVSPRFLAVDLKRQLLPGTFEHALDHLLDREIDLSALDARFNNDETGASAYPPAMLLKVILFAYSQGIVSSRGIEQACREHVPFIALCGDTAPHFTTLAGFISTLGEEVARIFGQVLFICDRQGLIGREMFAIDGVELPSNASKAKSGTCADFERRFYLLRFPSGRLSSIPRTCRASSWSSRNCLRSFRSHSTKCCSRRFILIVFGRLIMIR